MPLDRTVRQDPRELTETLGLLAEPVYQDNKGPREAGDPQGPRVLLGLMDQEDNPDQLDRQDQPDQQDQ